METEDMLPTRLKSEPVTVAWEIVTAAVPLLVRIKVCEVLDPRVTFPKLTLVALAASVPDAVELLFAAGVPAPVSPTQPERDNAAISARKMDRSVNGDGRFGADWECARRFVCDFIALTV